MSSSHRLSVSACCGAVGFHDEQLAVGLRNIQDRRLVLEAEREVLNRTSRRRAHTRMRVVEGPLVTCVSDVPSGSIANRWNSLRSSRLKTMRPFADQHGKLS